MSDLLKFIFGLFVIVLVIGFSLLVFEKFITQKTITINISLIEKKITKSGEEYYLIYTKNEIFLNRNNYFHGKHNVSSLAINLREGRSYKVKVIGYNFDIELPFFFKYRNIIDEVNTKKGIIY